MLRKIATCRYFSKGGVPPHPVGVITSACALSKPKDIDAGIQCVKASPEDFKLIGGTVKVQGHEVRS
jgi:hypothetical protein